MPRPPLPPDHPLHDEAFRQHVYEKALRTPARLMVEDNGFLDNMARGMALVQGGSRRKFGDRVSSFDDPEIPGGVMLLLEEYLNETEEA
jgi:hypothetical protein